MSSTPDKPYLAPYREAVRRHGATFEATLWLSREWQIGRFRVMTEMVDFTGRTILDAGCGLGDFAAALEEWGIGYGGYVGVEGMPELVAQARTRDLPEAKFIEADFVHDAAAFAMRPDLAVFSGSLNTLTQDEAIGVLERAWAASAEGVVFNFLSSRHGRTNAPDPSPARRFDPIEMLQWALSRTPVVQLRQDYFAGHDATIAMQRATA
jgi:SAM-dependent methyltransferase